MVARITAAGYLARSAVARENVPALTLAIGLLSSLGSSSSAEARWQTTIAERPLRTVDCVT